MPYTHTHPNFPINVTTELYKMMKIAFFLHMGCHFRVHSSLPTRMHCPGSRLQREVSMLILWQSAPSTTTLSDAPSFRATRSLSDWKLTDTCTQSQQSQYYFKSSGKDHRILLFKTLFSTRSRCVDMIKKKKTCRYCNNAFLNVLLLLLYIYYLLGVGTT